MKTFRLSLPNLRVWDFLPSTFGQVHLYSQLLYPYPESVVYPMLQEWYPRGRIIREHLIVTEMINDSIKVQ